MTAAREQSPSAASATEPKMETGVTAQSPPSDNDGGERPMRQQLKNTNIDSLNGSAHINRKRSLEDADAAADEHPTKRSREGTPESTSQTAPASDKSAAPKTQKTDNGPTVSDSELGSEPSETPLDFDTQTPLQSPSGTSSRNADGKLSCAPISTKITLPLKVAITITCAGAQTTQHLSIPLEVNIDIPSVEPVVVASSVSGEAKSHISISSGSAASIPFPKGYSQREPDNLREPDVPRASARTREPDVPRASPYPRASSYPQASPYPQVSPYPQFSPYPQVSPYPRTSAYPQAPAHPRAPAYPSAANYHHNSTPPSAASYNRDSDNGNQQKPASSDAKPQNETLNSSKTEQSKDSAFTASAFGKASAGSPFGLNNAKSAASPFATSKPNSTASTFASSAFNSTSAASPFALGGASTSGFGALGSGSSPFGSAFASKPGKVTSFASPNAPAPLGDSNSKSKVLGATKSDNEESDHESEAEPNDTFVAEKTDERFHEKTVETGEENETTKFSAKGKLYYFDDKKWKERGVGTFKVNTQTDSDGNISGRMIMRADGVLRVMLNSALFHDMNYGDTKGNRPLTKDIYLASNEDGKIGNLLLRLGNEDQANELHDVLTDILKHVKK